MKRLEDGDHGIWLVHSETSLYVIDLEQRRLKRVPGAVAGSHLAVDGAWVELRSLSGDGQWDALEALVECRLGAPLFAFVRHRDGFRTWRLSTLVQRIQQLSDASESGGADAGDARPTSGGRAVRFYDKAGNPISITEVVRFYADPEYRFVDHTTIGDVDVVTVWLGVDQDPFAVQPLIFGSAVIRNLGTDLEELVTEELAATEEQALANHRNLSVQVEHERNQ